eukprot:1802563-Rhodomonas_salina.1
MPSDHLRLSRLRLPGYPVPRVPGVQLYNTASVQVDKREPPLSAINVELPKDRDRDTGKTWIAIRIHGVHHHRRRVHTMGESGPLNPGQPESRSPQTAERHGTPGANL